MKKKIVAMCATVAIAAMAVGGTLAYFTDTTEADTNVMQLGDVSIVQLENGVETEGITAENVLPGDMIWKEIQVQNTGDNDVYARTIIAFENVAGKKADWSDSLAAYLDFRHSPVCGDYEEFVWVEGVEAGNKVYSVAIATYKEVIAAGTTSHASLYDVGFNAEKVTSELVAADTDFGKALADGYQIVAFSQAVQADNWAEGTDAEAALDKAFGAAGEANLEKWLGEVLAA